MQTTRGASLSDATNPDDGATGPEGGRPRRIAVLVAVAVTVLALDLVSKIIVVATLSDREPIRLLGGLVTLRLTRNSGAAFSIGTSMTFVFTLIAAGVVVAIARTARRLYSLPWAITLGLLLGGATGNLIDRLFRTPGPLRGHVVDWIEWPHWPVFNLADSAIVCGGVIAVLLASRGIQLDGTRATDPQPSPTQTPTAPQTDPQAAAAPESGVRGSGGSEGGVGEAGEPRDVTGEPGGTRPDGDG